jgi:integrase
MLRADVRRGEYRTLSQVTFAEFAPEWVRTYAGRTARGIREATREDYGRALGLTFDQEKALWEAADPPRGAVAFFGRIRLVEIEPRDMKKYAAEVAARGVSANTVRLALAPVKAMLATAVEEGLIRSNPASGIRFAQSVVSASGEEIEQAKALTEEEVRRLIEETADRWKLLVAFLGQTGLRPSEALALRWGDVDLGRRRVKVRRSTNKGRVGPPKTRHGRRDVPLSVGMAQALWNERKRGKAADSDPVFVGPDGGLVKREAVYRAVKAAGKRAGVPWADLRTLRHTCASVLFRRGFNPKQVQAWLGHHSAAFTLAVYVHLLPDDLPEPTFWDEHVPSRTGDPELPQSAAVAEG